MLTLDAIRERIGALPAIKTNEERRAAVEDIFFSLLCADIPLFAAFSDETPYLAPLNGKPHLFLRLFSHAQAAEQYAASHETLSVREITAVESLQLAKYALMHGGYGYLLNKGDKWTSIALTAYLRLFYARVLGDESLYDAAYAETIGQERENVPTDWHTQNIFLCAAPHEDTEPVDAAAGNDDGAVATDPDVPVEWDDGGINEVPETDSCAAVEETVEGDVIKSKGDAAKEGGGAEPNDPQGTGVGSADERPSAPPFPDERKRKRRTVSERVNVLRTYISRKMAKSRPRRRVLFFGGILIFCLLCFSGIVIHHYVTATSHYTQFCEAIDARDYGIAYTQYQTLANTERANQYLSEHLDSVIASYGNGSISGEETAASLRALTAFPPLQREIETARVNMEKLNVSKDAYERGKASDDITERLSLWRGVIPMDTVNTEAVQEAVSTHAAAWRTHLTEELVYYSTRVRSFAKERYELLDFWYPDAPALSEWAAQYRSDPPVPASTYPIFVKSVTAQKTGSGQWVLEIEWKNRSARSMKDVTFSVVAKDGAGKILASRDTAGSWSVFDAHAPGPFEPSRDEETYRQTWSGAFAHPMIESVELTAVNVAYEDGAAVCYALPKELERIAKE